MASIIECAKDGAVLRNTGTNEECLVGPVVRVALAKTDQEFATVQLAKSLPAWKTAIAAKDIVPLYDIEVLANANIEATFYEARNRYQTKSEKKVVTWEVHLGVCSYANLYSYNGKEMRMYEFTDDQKIVGVTNAAGVIVKGQLVSIEVGMLIPSVDDKPQYALVTVTYKDWKEFISNPVVLSPSWSNIDIKGIFDANIKIVSSTTTNVKFTIDGGCSGDRITSLEDADLTFTKPDGTPVIHTFVAADANGVYQFIGTGFVNGDLVGVNGVVSQPEIIYEGMKKVPIVIA